MVVWQASTLARVSKTRKPVAVVISVAGALLVLCLAGSAMVAAPKFMRFQERSQQSECRAQLRALATAERAYFEESKRFTVKLADLGSVVTPSSRFLYRVGPGPLAEEGVATRSGDAEQLDAALPREVRERLGLKGTCPTCELTMLCAANLDSDETLDVWIITVMGTPDGSSATQVTQLVDDQS